MNPEAKTCEIFIDNFVKNSKLIVYVYLILETTFNWTFDQSFAFETKLKNCHFRYDNTYD